PAYTIYLSAIFVEVLLLGNRIYYAKKIIKLDILNFLFKVICISVAGIILTILIGNYLLNSMTESYFRLLIVSLTSIIIQILYSYFIIFNNNERIIISETIRSIIKKLKNAKNNFSYSIRFFLC